jgi:hypothetical protein
MRLRCYCGPYFYCPVCRARRGLAAGLVLALAAGVSASSVTLSSDAYPRVTLKGAGLRVSCVVKPATERKIGRLTIGIEFYTQSRVDLEGEPDKDQITTTRTFDRLPCDVGPAFCLLEREDGDILSKAEFLVGGCSTSPDGTEDADGGR